ncbi:hypothetical protein CB0940_09811 [Cercospora beticola]|uniref:Uncharacterized protein n=1 Tax=Cercospora beticola TaxID=122368 RepID=A0A2G5HH44_CERBT|nr:hypothetical protein CB0940_09811 [Cercospora beticola]PIA91861.1 hypothetical protein CB0940_09811 [Cercospora beticola]WPB05845.1 hypothetical protein RHO25_010499 [Cercospora beticola]
MRNTNWTFALLAAAICAVKGQDLDQNDIPQECRSTCQPVVDTENRCDQQFDDDDNNNNLQPGIPANQQYRDCVCQDQNAAQALASCVECVARFPNYYLDLDDNNNPDTPDGPDGDDVNDPDGDDGQGQGNNNNNNNNRNQTVVDNDVAEWARICGLQVPGANNTSPNPTAGPTAAAPRVTATGSTTVVQTVDCDDLNDPDGPDGDNDDNPDVNEPQCTRTTVLPVFGTITGGNQTPGAAPTGVSTSFATSVGTGANGQTSTFTTGVAVATGAAALPAEAVSFFGAGAAALVAAFAL